MATTTRVVAVEEITEDPELKSIRESGIISSQFIEFKDMNDETLEFLYQNDPNLIMEKRPDWVKAHKRNVVN